MNGVDAIAFTAGVGENDDAQERRSAVIWDILERRSIRKRTMSMEKKRLFHLMIPK